MIKLLNSLDRQLLKKAYQLPFNNGVLVRFLIFAGDGPFWMMLILLSALIGQFANSPLFTIHAMLMMLAMGIGNFVLAPLKMQVSRQRPYANLAMQQQLGIEIENRDPGHGSKVFESFPSGHVYWTTLCVMIFWHSFGWPVLLLMGWMIPAMLLLRPHLGVHYPSDVLSGLLLGGLVALLVLQLLPLLVWLYGFQQSVYFSGVFWAGVAGFMVLGVKAWKKRI